MLAWRTSNDLSMTRRPPSRQDTGGLALRLTPGQSIVEMSHFQKQNEDGFHSQASLFSLRPTYKRPQQKPFAIQCISEMVQMPKKSKKYGRGQEFCVNIHQKAAPLQWEIQMPFFCSLEVCC